jgi:hypothetical protein
MYVPPMIYTVFETAGFNNNGHKKYWTIVAILYYVMALKNGYNEPFQYSYDKNKMVEIFNAHDIKLVETNYNEILEGIK